MDTGMEMGPGAAATATRAPVVPLEKKTVILCPKSEERASEFSHDGGEQ